MPRVHHRKARKDYPNSGITKGDMYYFTSLKLQRGGLIKRSLTPFKPSQLTNSPFKSGFLAAGEDWEANDKSAEHMRSVGEAITEVGSECQESFDNMPEGLQQGDTGQMLENRASECERIGDDLNQLADELEELEEPTEPEAPEGETDRDKLIDYQDDLSEYEELQTTYDDEIERITCEADELMGDMPE